MSQAGLGRTAKADHHRRRFLCHLPGPQQPREPKSLISRDMAVTAFESVRREPGRVAAPPGQLRPLRSSARIGSQRSVELKGCSNADRDKILFVNMAKLRCCGILIVAPLVLLADHGELNNLAAESARLRGLTPAANPYDDHFGKFTRPEWTELENRLRDWIESRLPTHSSMLEVVLPSL